MPWKDVRLDPTSLRGLAHPLRVRMLGLLREEGPATATSLADRLGQSTGATSYHLRQLAAYGFVVEDAERGVGRERWWKAAHQGTLLTGETSRQAPEETDAYLRGVAALGADRIDRFISEQPALPEAWQRSHTLSDWRLRLTPAEAAKLRDELFELLGRYRRDGDPDAAAKKAPKGAEVVMVQAQIMPFVRGAS